MVYHYPFEFWFVQKMKYGFSVYCKGKGAKIAIVNFKRGIHNLSKFEGAKLYMVNQNRANLTSLLDKGNRRYFTCGSTLNK